ncbi:TetR/AcrR family transcriptional regulator [Massilia sp. BSC265]|uniref:TetR/AcrR family transcriptional regulator n=1 Tax=Massilia sp. BSC265 TaxID=1549812 RepID=UPI0009DD93AC
MKIRSPSVERICGAAVKHFAEHGYDASSLNVIAEQVGIRKASLYTHFSGKGAVFKPGVLRGLRTGKGVRARLSALKIVLGT